MPNYYFTGRPVRTMRSAALAPGRASPDCKNDPLKVLGEDFALIFVSPIGP
jgi:hypothetical protein